jgi:hypothetical protein
VALRSVRENLGCCFLAVTKVVNCLCAAFSCTSVWYSIWYGRAGVGQQGREYGKCFLEIR